MGKVLVFCAMVCYYKFHLIFALSRIASGIPLVDPDICVLTAFPAGVFASLFIYKLFGVQHDPVGQVIYAVSIGLASVGIGAMLSSGSAPTQNVFINLTIGLLVAATFSFKDLLLEARRNLRFETRRHSQNATKHGVA